MIDKKGVFPTGLVHRAKSFLKDQGIKGDVIDLRKQPVLKQPRPLSLPVVPYADQTRAVDIAVNAHQATLSLPTGTGKSLIIALIAARLNVKTLVVVPSLEIKMQLTTGIKEFLGNLTGITVLNIDSPELKKANNYDCLIIDEAHRVAAKTYQILNKTAWSGIYYRYFLTATPYRNRTDETLLFEGIAGPLKYSLSYKDAVARGYIVPVEAYYLEFPKVNTEAYTWAQVYSELVVNNDFKNKKIASLVQSLTSNNIPTLCLVKEIKHGENLQQFVLAPFANGKDEDTRGFLKDFSGGRINTLIATTGIAGEGVDTKPAEFVIIAGLGKAKSAFMQQIGRGVRKYANKTSAKIILIKDKSHKFTLRHFNAQVKILKDEFGIAPVRLELE